MLTSATLENQVVDNPFLYRDKVQDVGVTEWDVVNQTCLDSGDGYEFFGGDCFVKRADVWIGEEIVNVDRKTLFALIGIDKLNQIETSETQDRSDAYA